MRKLQRILVTIAAIGAIFGMAACGHSDHGSGHADGHDHHHEQQEVIALDNGNKWDVPDNMMVHVRTMQEGMRNHLAKPESERDVQAIMVVLDNAIEGMTSNCTMRGQGHDELHKWLVPFIEMAEELSESTDHAEQARMVGVLADALTEFDSYFE